MCSLRRLVVLLPSGTPAPRLSIHLPPNKEDHQLSSDLYSIDDTYTSTTSLTDFDEGVVADYVFTIPQTSTPSSIKHSYMRSRPKEYTKRFCSIQVLSDGGATMGLSQIRTFHSDNASSNLLSSSEHRLVQATRSRKPTRRTPAKYSISKRYQRRRPIHTHSLTNSSFHLSSNIESSSSDLSDTHSKHRTQKSKNPFTAVVDSKFQPLPALTTLKEYQHADRITHLETELAHLRSQLAQLIIMQEGKQPVKPSPMVSVCDQHLEDAGEKSTVSVVADETQFTRPYSTVDSNIPEVVQCNLQPANLLPPPETEKIIPPPPPPISLRTEPTTDWRAQLIAKRNKNITSNPSPPTAGSADMTQVLKELQSGSIRLRAVPRSPGGTPVRAREAVPSREMDPQSIITQAMRNQIRKIRAALELSTSGTENTPDNSTNDSIPLHTGNSPASNDKPGAFNSFAPFGQHLLRSTRNRDSATFSPH